MNPERQKASVEMGGVPCRNSSLKDPEILAKFPQYEAVRRALESGIYRPVMEQWPSFYTILGHQMESVLNGEETVEKALFYAQKQLEVMLDNEHSR